MVRNPDKPENGMNIQTTSSSNLNKNTRMVPHHLIGHQSCIVVVHITKARTRLPLVKNSNSLSEYVVWETYRPEHLIIKSSNDKTGVSSVNLNRLSTCIVRFNEHITTKFDDDDNNVDNDDDDVEEKNEDVDADDNDDDEDDDDGDDDDDDEEEEEEDDDDDDDDGDDDCYDDDLNEDEPHEEGLNAEEKVFLEKAFCSYFTLKYFTVVTELFNDTVEPLVSA